MTRYGQSATIAATTAGVAGTIIAPKGARLVGLNAAFAVVDDIPKTIEMKFQNGVTRKYVFPISAQTQTTQAATATAPTPLIPIEGIVLDSEKTITFTIVSTGNITVRLGLMWDAS